MKIKGAKSTVKQVTFEGKHPSNGIMNTIVWYKLRNILSAHYKNQPDNILSFKITPIGLAIFYKDFF